MVRVGGTVSYVGALRPIPWIPDASPEKIFVVFFES